MKIGPITSENWDTIEVAFKADTWIGRWRVIKSMIGLFWTLTFKGQCKTKIALTTLSGKPMGLINFDAEQI